MMRKLNLKELLPHPTYLSLGSLQLNCKESMNVMKETTTALWKVPPVWKPEVLQDSLAPANHCTLILTPPTQEEIAYLILALQLTTTDYPTAETEVCVHQK